MLARLRSITRLGFQFRRSLNHTAVVCNTQTDKAEFTIDDILSNLEDVKAPEIKTDQYSKERRDINVLIHRLNQMPVSIRGHEFNELAIVEDIETLAVHMNSGEIISVLNALGIRYVRHVDIITQLSEQLIRLRQDITPDQFTSLALSMRQLSFNSPRLIKYLVSVFVSQADKFVDWNQITAISYSFGQVKVNSPTFWTALSKVMEANIGNAFRNMQQVRRTISSCAIVNVPIHLIKRSVDLVVADLKKKPKTRTFPNDYLNIVHSLAILNSLSNYEANKVLQPEFFEELQDQYRRNFINPNEDLPNELLVRLVGRILQIGACCRYDMGIKPKLSKNMVDFAKKNTSSAEKVRHGRNVLTIIEEFKQNLHIIAPLDTHSIAPHLDISTGAFVDAIVYVCPKRRVIISLAEGERSPDAEKVAIIFASFGLMTNMDAGTLTENEYPLSRPLGEIKMNLRHLRAKKCKPVLIDHFTFSSLLTDSQKILFIKESILKPYEDQNKDWMSEPISFFPVSEDVAISSKSVSSLLGVDSQVLTYSVKFKESSDEKFAFGFCRLSPMDSYDYEDVRSIVAFLELESHEPDELRAPYAEGTIMYVSIFRKAGDANYVHIAIKVGDHRSGTYAFQCKANQDYLAISCKPAVLVGGLINFMNTEQYLEDLDEKKEALCTICMDKPAVIYYEECGHVTYCYDCCLKDATANMKCPFCGSIGFNIANKINKQTPYCVNCINRKCTDLNTLYLPCRCLISCQRNVKTFAQCQLCDQIVSDTKKIYLP